MNKKFLEDICEAYIVDSGLKNVEKETLYTEFRSLLDDLRLTDFELYHEFNSLSPFSQQKILKTYFDLEYIKEDEVILDGVITTTLLGVGGVVIGRIFFKGIQELFLLIWDKRYDVSETVRKAMYDVGKKFDTFGEFISNAGKEWKFRYSIIANNTEECYTRCNVTEGRDLPANVYGHLKQKEYTRYAVSPEHNSKINCLRDCYVKAAIDSIALLMKMYFNCMKRTGNFEQIKGLRYDDLVSSSSGIHISEACQDNYQQALKAIKTFNELLDFLYGDDNHLKQRPYEELKNSLMQARNQISNSRDFQQAPRSR